MHILYFRTRSHGEGATRATKQWCAKSRCKASIFPFTNFPSSVPALSSIKECRNLHSSEILFLVTANPRMPPAHRMPSSAWKQTLEMHVLLASLFTNAELMLGSRRLWKRVAHLLIQLDREQTTGPFQTFWDGHYLYWLRDSGSCTPSTWFFQTLETSVSMALKSCDRLECRVMNSLSIKAIPSVLSSITKDSVMEAPGTN